MSNLFLGWRKHDAEAKNEHLCDTAKVAVKLTDLFLSKHDAFYSVSTVEQQLPCNNVVLCPVTG